MPHHNQRHWAGRRAAVHCGMCTDLPLLRPGEPGLELLLALLMVSMRDDLVCSCLPAVDRGLFTAPRTLAALG